MPAYSFKERFANMVEHGYKNQTIRSGRKHAVVGATAYLYTGMRTKACRKLGEGTLIAVLPVEIGRHACGEPYAVLNEAHLTHAPLDAFARADGFDDREEMTAWFEKQYGLPFVGYLHKWVVSNIKVRGGR